MFFLCFSIRYENFKNFTPIFYQLQASNGHRKFQNTTTSLSIPSTEDEMIDITPRESNYTSTMAGGEGRQPGSPSHGSSAYARDRELNDAEGKNIHINHSFDSILVIHRIQKLFLFKFGVAPFGLCSFVISCTTLTFIRLFRFRVFLSFFLF